jgi:hypothetical protein
MRNEYKIKTTSTGKSKSECSGMGEMMAVE